MLSLANTTWLLLAQAARDDKQRSMTTVSPGEVSKALNDGIKHDLPWELLLAGLGATLVTIALISVHRWWGNRNQNPSPAALYSAIARKAGLGWRDRYLLWRVSKTFDLPTPITLMLSKGTLRHYADQYARHRTHASQQRITHRIARIESDLFSP